MGEIIEPLVLYSEAGCPVACGDDNILDLCPNVLVYSSDVEEQYVFSVLVSIVYDSQPIGGLSLRTEVGVVDFPVVIALFLGISSMLSWNNSRPVPSTTWMLF